MNRITGKRSVCIAAVVAVIGCALVGQRAAADTIAVQDWSGAMEYTTNYTAVNGGYEFTVGSTPITITKLGFFDYGADGLSESHEVGIWELGDTAALATATITSTSALEGDSIAGVGQFRYEDLATVLELSANTTYRIAAYYSSTHADAWAQSSTGGSVTWTLASEITYDAPRYVYASGLAYPSNEASPRTLAYFGPGFQFVNTVPEPGTLALLLSGAAAALAVLRRRRSS